MKLLFLTFAPIENNPGHLARVVLILKELSQKAEVTILCLGTKGDSDRTKLTYPNTKFLHMPLSMNGWEVENLHKSKHLIKNIVETIKPNLTIQCMEVWDLMRELSLLLKPEYNYSVIIHAMPFLGAPIHNLGTFEDDIKCLLKSEISQYRKDYITEHYKEAEEVFSRLNIIANNLTVSFYLKHYFSPFRMWILKPSSVTEVHRLPHKKAVYKYDFAYMARMEKGKGVEYLSSILPCISNKLKRKVSIAIMGRTDDKFSMYALNRLIKKSKRSDEYSIDYLGWANTEDKLSVLSDTSVFLYPSHYDNYPTVLNEALSFGVPTVTWECLFSQLNYSRTAAVLRVPLLDYEAFASGAVYALNNRETLSISAYNFINNFPNPSTLVANEMETFTKIINSNIHEKP